MVVVSHRVLNGSGRRESYENNGLQTRNMKHRMNTSEIGWQSESDRDRAKDLNDAEWSNEFGSQLMQGVLKGKVCSREPNPLSTDITGASDTTLISGPTRNGARLTKGGLNRSPSSSATLDKRFYRWHIGFGVGGREEGRLVPQTALKRRQTGGRSGGRSGGGIIGILCPRKLFYPRRGITKCKAAQQTADSLVNAFGLTIRLGMKPGGETG
ncbi:hypothetical protein PO909_008708 [Leuciscus waleckii]